MVYDPWGIFPSKNTICVSWVCNILRRNNMVWFFCTLVAFQVIMWKSKEFEDIWWCKNQINVRCQSGFGWEYNHCDRYATVKAEKIQFLKRRIFQKKKISNFWTKDLLEIVRNDLLYFLMFWFYDKDNAVSTVEQISDQEFWFWLKRKNIAWISTFLWARSEYVQK